MTATHHGPTARAASESVDGAVWRDRFAIVAAYALSWGLLLVNRGLYWDDWTLIGVPAHSILTQYHELGMPWLAALSIPLVSLPLPGLVGHAIVFVAYLASALLLHATILRLPGIGRIDALVMGLVFAVFPVNYARIAIIDLPYGLSLLAFLAAAWLLVRQVETGGWAGRASALVLFAASFTTASLLVFYVVPIGVAYLVDNRSRGASFRSFVRRYPDFLLLPVIYWLIKSVVFRPSGTFADYNQLTIHGLLGVPRAMLGIPPEVITQPIRLALTVAGLAGLVVGALAAVWLVRRGRSAAADRLMPTWVLLVGGIALIAIGVFPYLAVGRTPSIWDWSSRHQLLVPLGAGLVCAACCRFGSRRGIPRTILVGAVGFLVGVSVVANARTLLAFQQDWFKQVALMQAVRDLPAARTAHHIAITDTATRLNALRRTYRFYELNALFEQSLGGTDRLVSIAGGEPSVADLSRFTGRPTYHMGDYVAAPVDLQVEIAPGTRPGALETLRLVALEALGSDAFPAEVARLVDVTATTVGPSGTP